MSDKMAERTESLRDLIYFPIIYNVAGLLAIGILYTVSPRILVEPDALNTVLYLVVFITHWLLVYFVGGRIGMHGVKELIVPKKKLRWPPSLLVFISLSVLFTTYMVLGLTYGRIPAWGSLNFLQITFFFGLAPLTAGFVEELIWRGYFMKKLLAMGKTESKAVILSSISFAFIHGFFVFDKLIVTFLFGIIAGTYYVRERNLPVLMASHVITDIVAFALPFFY